VSVFIFSNIPYPFYVVVCVHAQMSVVFVIVLLHILANIALRAWSRGAYTVKSGDTPSDASLTSSAANQKQADVFAADICQTLHSMFTVVTFLMQAHYISYEAAFATCIVLMLEYVLCCCCCFTYIHTFIIIF